MPNRRSFLFTLGLPAPALLSAAQKKSQRDDRQESLRPAATPAIAMCHAGYLPDARKTVLYRYSGEFPPDDFSLRDIGGPPKPFQQTRPLEKASGVIECFRGDFSDLQREAMYQVMVGDERSVPFFIGPEVWRRTLTRAVGYYRYQRCGVEVPGVHPACHLDDARRRDNGAHVDTTGGWHDAGDLRKWMGATLFNGLALLRLERNLGEAWDPAGSGARALLEEVRWGNRYFLKMQDSGGLVFADVAGGVNGDNSDNHWTDNKTGTSDDRYLNPAKSGRNQAMFTMLEAMAAQAYRRSDPEYAALCLKAAERCWNASKRTGGTLDVSWWTLAALELNRATRREPYATAACLYGAQLLGLQTVEFIGAQKEIRGFWRESESSAEAFTSNTSSALPGLALLELNAAFPQHQDTARWRDAVRMHLEEYLLPLASRSAYEIVPFAIYRGTRSQELYRPLAGELTYRFFMPCRSGAKWMGLTSHLESNALLLAMAAGTFGQRKYRDLAYRQFEWVMGANPFGACLMTGEGMRNPYPHSRFVGLIPGGILNGIAGNAKDEPVLDTEYGFDWRTTEYWSPHNAWYIWAHSVLEARHAAAK